MESRRLNRYLTSTLPLAVLSVLVAVALFMTSAATQNSAYFSGLYSLLLIVTLVGIVLLTTLILFNLRHLVSQVRAQVLGSRLTLRLLGIFVMLTFIPVSAVYVFSLQLLNKGVDSWFDIKIEQALNDALSLGRAAISALQEDMVTKTRAMAADLEAGAYREVAMIDDLREQYGVTELTLFGADGRIVASSSQQVFMETQSLVPDRPSDTILNQVRQGLPYAKVDTGEAGLQLRVVVPVYGREVGTPVRALQMLQPLASRYGKLGDSVQSAFSEYEKLMYLRKPLKFGFTLTLTLVALLSLLISVWTAIFLARRLVAPIRDLAEGTRAVARGDYRKRIPVVSDDEFGVLVQSFNDMTRKIHRAQSQIKRSQREAEAQRTYLETVLTHLSSGVLSLDARYHLRTHNASAGQILGADLSTNEGHALTRLAELHPHLAPFVNVIAETIDAGRDEWQAEAALMGPAGRRLLSLRGTLLPGLDGRRAGCVIVFDDVTNLVQAQRDAAWGEVARRLAHEIKNPLTPIQLSAERIRRKCMDELDERKRDTLDRATGTIIRQVEAMKSMVNEFSDYARPLQTQLEPLDVNSLVRDVVELYKGKHENLTLKLNLDDALPMVMAEPRRLRQVLHNLLLNATDALVAVPKPALELKTRCLQEAKCRFIELQVRDNGPGFAPVIMDRLFEPYVTNKEKGTGLGLAIVKKIVEDHGGMVRAENLPQGGAVVSVRLPARDTTAAVNATQERRA